MSDLITESTIILIKAVRTNTIIVIILGIISISNRFFTDRAFDKLEARLDRVEKLLEIKTIEEK